MNNNELYHYGVLGMRWGVHRAKKYASKSRREKALGNDEKAKEYSNKSKRIMRKHEKLAGGKDVIDYTTSQSLGKSIVKSYVFGTYGALKYDKAKAQGRDTGEAAISGLGHAFLNMATNGLVSIVEPRVR